MKKVLLSAVALLAFGFANAQEEKGNGGFAKSDLYLSGSVGLSNTKMGDIKSDSYSFSPAVGYFLSENIALEAGLMVNKTTMEIEGESMDVKGFGGSLGAKYYFTPADKFSFFVGAGLGYMTQKIGDSDTVDFNTFSFAVAPGINYFFNSNFAAQANIGVLGYSSSKMDVSGADAMNTFSLGLDATNLNFALIYKF